ncbi:MAG: Fe-S cluster assembly scaffold IscU [Candidatus Sumerlaeia bacterium]
MLIPFTVKAHGARRGMPYNNYSEQVLEHFNNPRNVGRLDKDDPRVGTGVAQDPAKGDLIRFQVMVDEQGRIVDARFKAYGCGSAIASASALTTLIIGRTVSEAEQPCHAEIMRLLDLPPEKKAYAALAEEALLSALADHARKHQRTAARQPEP